MLAREAPIPAGRIASTLAGASPATMDLGRRPFWLRPQLHVLLLSTRASPATMDLAPLRRLLRATTERTGASHFPRLEDSAQDDLAYEVNVTNTGTMDADEVVLGFLTPPNAGMDGAPLKQLFGFERPMVHDCPAGATVTAWLYPSWTDFTSVNLDGSRELNGEWRRLHTHLWGGGAWISEDDAQHVLLALRIPRPWRRDDTG